MNFNYKPNNSLTNPLIISEEYLTSLQQKYIQDTDSRYASDYIDANFLLNQLLLGNIPTILYDVEEAKNFFTSQQRFTNWIPGMLEVGEFSELFNYEQRDLWCTKRIILSLKILSIKPVYERIIIISKDVCIRINEIPCGVLVNPQIEQNKNKMQAIKKSIRNIPFSDMNQKRYKELEIENLKLEHQDNFKDFGIGPRIRVGMWKSTCCYCMENFDVVSNTSEYVGFINLCCEGHDVCGQCLAQVNFKTFQKFKNGNLCPHFDMFSNNINRKKYNGCHALPANQQILMAYMKQCSLCNQHLKCCEGGCKQCVHTDSTHFSLLSSSNTALPPDVIDFRTQGQKTLEEKMGYGRSTALYLLESILTPTIPEEFWELIAPLDHRDPNRIVYHASTGEPVYYVDPPFTGENLEMNPDTNDLPRICWYEFINKSHTEFGMKYETRLSLYLAKKEQQQILTKKEILLNLQRKKRLLPVGSLGIVIDNYIEMLPNNSEGYCSAHNTHPTIRSIFTPLFFERLQEHADETESDDSMIGKKRKKTTKFQIKKEFKYDSDFIKKKK